MIDSLRQSASQKFERVKSSVGSSSKSGGGDDSEHSTSTMMDSLRQSASQKFERVKSTVGIETKKSEETDVLDELSDLCPKLTYRQRLIGFLSCFAIGHVISFMSFSFFMELIDGDPLPFVLLYTVGNILALLSMWFLCGPKRHFKNMFDKRRKWTSITYLACLFLTLIVCFIPFDAMLKLTALILLVIIQFCASVWYSMSYIPFARRAATKCMKDMIGLDQV